MAQGMLAAKGMGWAFVLLMLNPMAPIVILYRWVLLAPNFSQPELEPNLLMFYTCLMLIVSVGFFTLGRIIFSHYSRKFADEL
jgi:ABC-type polysaccharide/polyol phosphate export permease